MMISAMATVNGSMVQYRVAVLNRNRSLLRALAEPTQDDDRQRGCDGYGCHDGPAGVGSARDDDPSKEEDRQRQAGADEPEGIHVHGRAYDGGHIKSSLEPCSSEGCRRIRALPLQRAGHG